MIVTITPNTALDHTLYVPALVPGEMHRATRSTLSMAGKTAVVSCILAELGLPSLALGFAAGRVGEQMEAMLRARGVDTDFVWVEGETRLNTVIVSHNGDSQTTITTATPEVSAGHVEALRRRVEAALDGATCVALGGSLPGGVEAALYTELVRAAREQDIPLILDSSGAGMQAGLEGGPTVIKPNRDELAELAGQPLSSVEAAHHAARDLLTRYGTSVIVTMGNQGAIAVLPGRAYRVPPLPVEVVNPAGAGDAVLAGMAAALSRGEPLEAGLRLGFAAAGAVLLNLGTGECRRADVERLLPTVELAPL